MIHGGMVHLCHGGAAAHAAGHSHATGQCQADIGNHCQQGQAVQRLHMFSDPGHGARLPHGGDGDKRARDMAGMFIPGTA